MFLTAFGREYGICARSSCIVFTGSLARSERGSAFQVCGGLSVPRVFARARARACAQQRSCDEACVRSHFGSARRAGHGGRCGHGQAAKPAGCAAFQEVPHRRGWGAPPGAAWHSGEARGATQA
eukprot:7512658-Lingulodinium_polyedra.AAC.1